MPVKERRGRMPLPREHNFQPSTSAHGWRIREWMHTEHTVVTSGK